MAAKMSASEAPRLGRYAGGHLPESRIAFHAEEVADPNAADARDAAEIVAHHVDDHGVLRAVLFRSRQRGRPPAIVFRPEPASGRAFHWPGDDAVPLQLKEQFRRGRANGKLFGFDVGCVCRPLRFDKLCETASTDRRRPAAGGRCNSPGTSRPRRFSRAVARSPQRIRRRRRTAAKARKMDLRVRLVRNKRTWRSILRLSLRSFPSCRTARTTAVENRPIRARPTPDRKPAPPRSSRSRPQRVRATRQVVPPAAGSPSPRR